MEATQRVSGCRGMDSVRMNARMRRPYPSKSAESLLHRCRCPWKIDVNDHTCILEVHSFAEDVSCQQHRDRFSPTWSAAHGRFGSEPRNDFLSRDTAARYLSDVSAQCCYLTV